MALNATFVVQFAAGETTAAAASNHLSAEIDDRLTGLNAGKKSFAPGDTVWFLIYKGSNVTLDSVITTSGTVTASTPITVEREEEIVFAMTDAGQTEVPVVGAITSYEWAGSSLGAVTVQADKTTVKSATSGAGIATIKYNATAIPYKLVAPATINGKTDFSILIVIAGSAIE